MIVERHATEYGRAQEKTNFLIMGLSQVYGPSEAYIFRPFRSL